MRRRIRRCQAGSDAASLDGSLLAVRVNGFEWRDDPLRLSGLRRAAMMVGWLEAGCLRKVVQSQRPHCRDLAAKLRRGAIARPFKHTLRADRESEKSSA